jgi:hypothetical protein
VPVEKCSVVTGMPTTNNKGDGALRTLRYHRVRQQLREAWIWVVPLFVPLFVPLLFFCIFSSLSYIFAHHGNSNRRRRSAAR